MMRAFVTHEQDATTGRADGCALTVKTTIGPETGFPLLTQQLLRCESGSSGERHVAAGHETLFVLSGHGTLVAAGGSETLEPETGVTLTGGERYSLQGSEEQPLKLLSVHVPGPTYRLDGEREAPVVCRLADLASQPATTGREFRVIADPASGLPSATSFVGYIPATRAPDHYHRYDEVIHLLEGEGTMHMLGEHFPLRAGSCIALPARTVHCLENLSGEPMRVAAVFRPGVSPAAAYYPDGTPAYAG